MDPRADQPPSWTRRRALAAGAGGIAALLLGCSSADERGDGPDRIGRVLVIGAGPAGLSTAHLLRRRGVEVEVFEARSTHGGRTRHDLSFADFPIPLGAEWVHGGPELLDEIVDDPDVDVRTELVPYGDDAFLGWYEDGLELEPLEDDDLKFAGSGWLDFFDTYIVPGIADRIRYDTPIVTVDHGGDRVRLTDAAGDVHEGDRVVVTVPLRLLQRRDLDFRPDLPADRWRTIDSATVWSGFKAFFEFDRRFYPAAVSRPGDDTRSGQRLLYDAAYGQDTDLDVLGLFAVGDWAVHYLGLSDEAVRDDVLAELDEIFDGVATPAYVRHITQRWDDEPYARGAYLEDDAPSSISRRLAEPIGERLFFAGDAYTTFDDWSSVHTATRSAADTVARLLR